MTSAIDRIIEIFALFGEQTYGENTTQLSHALQCAHLARSGGGSDALVAAALLHDIGQFIGDAGNAAERLHIDARHEIAGAEFLSSYFPPEVSEPVRLHVAAKRYLCSIDPAYYEKLSHASQLSLQLQGGPMTQAEAAEFSTRPFAKDAVRLRRFDDEGKEETASVPELSAYLPLLRGLYRADS